MIDYEKFIGDGSRQDFLKLAAEYDEPAFVRRAQMTELVSEQVFSSCEASRHEMLELPKKRLAILGLIVDGRWNDLEDLLRSTLKSTETSGWTTEYLCRLHQDWKPTLRVQIATSQSARKRRQAIHELDVSFRFFNRKWTTYIDDFDLESVNQVREDYNNYYVLEKACAFGSEKIAANGFEPLAPISRESLRERFPLLLTGTGD